MSTVYEIAQISELTKDTAKVFKNGDFPSLSVTKNGEEQTYNAVQIKRAFPFEKEDEFIVIADKDGKDLGFYRRLSDLPEEEQSILREELCRRYFMPKIKKVLKANDRFGFSYWKVETDVGALEFSMQDTYKSILYLGSRMILTDADGNRYEIPDVRALDRSSKKKIEIYLR